LKDILAIEGMPRSTFYYQLKHLIDDDLNTSLDNDEQVEL